MVVVRCSRTSRCPSLISSLAESSRRFSSHGPNSSHPSPIGLSPAALSHDLANLLASGRSQSETGKSLITQLRRSGYCYVSVVPEPSSPLVSLALQELKVCARTMMEATARDAADCERCRTTTGFRGWYRYVGARGASRDNISCFAIGRPVDTAEAAAALRLPYYSSIRGVTDTDELERIGIFRTNVWPYCSTSAVGTRAGAPRRLLEESFERLADLAEHLLDFIALGLAAAVPQWTPALFPHLGTCSASIFRSALSNRDHSLELKLYPSLVPTSPSPRPRPTNQRTRRINRTVVAQPLGVVTGSAVTGDEDAALSVDRLASHQDLSMVTLLAQDNLGGLEVWDNRVQAFVAVPVLDDALLVNCGAFLDRWTAGFLEATPHRVRTLLSAGSSRALARCSAVFFTFPNFHQHIVPLSSPATVASTVGDRFPPPHDPMASDAAPMASDAAPSASFHAGDLFPTPEHSN